MRFKRRSHPSISSDATPMADIVFLLLIFFMISSSFIIQPGIKINLPEAATSEAQLEKQLLVTVSKDSKVFINKEEVSLKDLERELKAVFLNMQDKVLIIKADRRVTHGTVVEVMDKAKLAGAQRLAIATEMRR
ncbi:MAG: biopolymer transporter ExbD [bacterium]